MTLWTTKITVSKYPCLTFTATMQCLDAKISSVPNIVPHSTFNLIGPCNTHPNKQTHKPTKIHTLTPLTYEICFQNSSKRLKTFRLLPSSFQNRSPPNPLRKARDRIKTTLSDRSSTLFRGGKKILKGSGRDNSEKIRQILRHIYWQAIVVLIVLQPITDFRWQTWPG